MTHQSLRVLLFCLSIASAIAAENPWTLRTEALWLERDYPGNLLLAQVVSQTAVPLGVDVATLDDVSDRRMASGLRLSLERRCKSGKTLELTGFGFQQWGQSRPVFGFDPPFVNSTFLGNSIMFPNNSFDTNIVSTYISAVTNVEANLKCPHPVGNWQGATLVGLRYFRLWDRLQQTGTQGFQQLVEQTQTRATNDLFGVQVGGEVWKRFSNDRLELGFTGKVGLFANFADQTTSNSTRPFAGGGTTALQAGRSETDLANLFEVGVHGTRRITKDLSFRLGYQALLVQGLALAPDQLATTGTSIREFPDVPFPPGTGAGLRTNRDLFFHGPSMGIEVAF
jgi:hypothetical protein